MSIAFTSMSLYGMLSGPLNNIPNQLIVWAQARLALERLENFFEERSFCSASFLLCALYIDAFLSFFFEC